MRNGEPTAAVDYVSRNCKTRCLDATGRALLEADLRGWWRGTAAATRRTYLVENGTKVKLYKAIKQARRFVVDTDLEAWVDDQNVRKGINPLPRSLLQKTIAVKRHLGIEPTANHWSARRWMQSWRKRRGIQLRRGAVREQLTIEQMHEQVIYRSAQSRPVVVCSFWLAVLQVDKNQ